RRHQTPSPGAAGPAVPDGRSPMHPADPAGTRRRSPAPGRRPGTGPSRRPGRRPGTVYAALSLAALGAGLAALLLLAEPGTIRGQTAAYIPQPAPPPAAPA